MATTTTRERIEKLLQTDPNISFAKAKEKLNMPMSPTYFRKVKIEWQETHKSNGKGHTATKPAKTAPSGAGSKAAIYKLLETHGTKLSFADAEPLLVQQGIKTSSNWFNRCARDYKKEQKKGKVAAKKHVTTSHHAATPASNGTLTGKSTKFAAALVQARDLIKMTGSKQEALALLEIV